MKPQCKKMVETALHSGLPVPGPIRPLVRMMHTGGVQASEFGRLVYKWLVVAPVMRSVASVGPGLRIERIPYMRGKGRIVIGAHVYMSGQVVICFAHHRGNQPEFSVGSRTFIGHQCVFSAAEKITIGDDCLISGDVRIQDNDGHPLDPDRRREREPVAEADVRPVTIGNNVWLAHRSTILKGVTIGDNSVVGAGAVVTKDVPANVVVAGNPASVVKTLAVADDRGPGEP